LFRFALYIITIVNNIRSMYLKLQVNYLHVIRHTKKRMWLLNDNRNTHELYYKNRDFIIEFQLFDDG